MGDYDLLLGKRTYDIFAAYWPYNQDNPIGAKFQRINKYVLTHSDEPLEWENSHRLSGDDARTRSPSSSTATGRDLLIQGSSTLYPPLLVGAADRPAGPDDLPGAARQGQAHLRRVGAAGRAQAGRPFRDQTGRRHRRPTSRPATFRPGRFETKQPSEAELERREKMGARGSW